MTLLWSKDLGATRYEVRGAGNTRRLYTDGVLHTEYNPARAVTGSVWDLLFLPAMFYPAGAVKRVLVLGVGGGAVIHLLLRHVQPQQIIGVDLDAVHLQVARRHFKLRDKRVHLQRADARQWLALYEGERFDMVVEDLFADNDHAPVRAVTVDQTWLHALHRLLTKRGCLVVNFINHVHLRNSAVGDPGVERKFPSRYTLSTPATENRVAVLLRTHMDKALLRPRLRTTPELKRSLEKGRLRYNIRAL